MAVKKVLIDGSFYITYPTDYVFGRERNYLILEEYGEQVYINSIHFFKSSGETKTINLSGYDLLKNKKFLLDATAYYQWGFDEIGYNYTDMDGSVFADRIQIRGYTFLDCYDPYKELTPRTCDDHQYIMIAPPHRMLFTTGPISTIKSLFVTKNLRSNIWELNGVDYSSQIIMQSIPITQTNFVALYKNANSVVIRRIERIADLIDESDISKDWVQVNWRTRWGFDVSHIFYLDTYATDKEDAKEVESEYLYEEHSKHVIKGSFYLDHIKDPYDLWYYQTLANSELVIFTSYKASTLPHIYIPNGTNSLNGVKITGCNIKDAVVDGLAQSTITFDFEMR